MTLLLARRPLLLGLTGASLAGCAAQPKKTPLAHLYGDEWVRGAYVLYAKEYREVSDEAQTSSFKAYGTLAKRGATSLTNLQSRGVPFDIRVQAGDGSFRVERNVPERLTYEANMTEEDRRRAKESFEKAREHLHTDYDEIQRLDGSLTVLLQQVQRVRRAIDAGDLEEFRLVRQINTLAAGQEPPFPLPYKVNRDDYREILHLLLERLDDDTRGLASLEANIVSVGLVARATDQRSGSRAENLHRVLLSVAKDAEASGARAPTYPSEADRQKALARGKSLVADIAKDPIYQRWEKRERTSDLDRIGSLVAMLDGLTGLPVSTVYRQAIDIWRGEADYLSYLRTVASFVPGGSTLGKVLTEALAITDKARQVAATVDAAMSGELLQAQLRKRGAGLLNVENGFGRTRLGKQLVFFEQAEQAARVREEVLALPSLGG